MNRIKYIVLVGLVLVGLFGPSILVGIPTIVHASSSLTFYPDLHTESTSVDGEVARADDAIWATVRNSAGTYYSDTGVAATLNYIKSSTTNNQWVQINRTILLFDTSSIPNTAVITSATLSVYGCGKLDDLSITPDLNIYGSTPASNVALANADYGQTGTTAFCDTPITYGNWSITGYNTFTLNAAGLAAIQVAGISKFSAKNANYDVANNPPAWSSNKASYVQGYLSDFTANKPKLIVNFTVAPILTISSATNVVTTTATLNGTVTDAGDDNPTVTVYWGTTDHPGTSSGWDHSGSPTSPTQPQAAVAFHKDVTGLNPYTTYYFTAKATSSSGTAWPAASESFNTGANSISYIEGAMTDACLVWWGSGMWNFSTAYDVRVGCLDTTGATKQGSGIRWTGVALPQGATITSATIDFYSNVSYSGTTVSSVLTGALGTNPATFSTISNFQARRGTVVGGTNNNYITTATVNWNSIAPWTSGTTYTTPDISTIVQEIVNQAGWTPGSSLVIYWDDFTGSSTSSNGVFREAASYASTSSTLYAPVLNISYSIGLPTVTTSAASSITDIGATLNGDLTSIGSSSVTARGCYWGTTTGYGHDLPDTGSSPFSVSTFGLSLTGLSPSTVYHYKAYATNGSGTITGGDQYFSTLTYTGEGYLGGYGYTKQFTIVGMAASSGTSIQVPIHVYAGGGSDTATTVYLNNHCTNFPNDIDFTSSDGETTIPYWVETQTSSDAIVWVKIPYIPVFPGTTSAYIYYGNPTVISSASNGFSTWNYFNDFNYSLPVIYNSGTPVMPSGGVGTWDRVYGSGMSGGAIQKHSTVIVNGVWYTYYCSVQGYTGSIWPISVGMATSTDGINWTKYPNNPIFANVPGVRSYWDPKVIYVDGKFILYVCSAGPNGNSNYQAYFSNDGFNFTFQGWTLGSNPPNGCTDPTFVYNPSTGVYSLYVFLATDLVTYTHGQIYVSTSTDGVNYNFSSRAPIQLPGEGNGTTEISTAYPSQVILKDGYYYLLYFDPLLSPPITPAGYDSRLRVGLAKSANGLTDWTSVCRDIVKGCDPELVESSTDTWNLYLCYDTYRDYAGTNSYTMFTYSGVLDQIGSFSTDIDWINNISTQATVAGGELVINKSTNNQKGVVLTYQLSSTCIVGFKVTDLSYSNTADISILNIASTGASSSQAGIQQTSAGALQGYDGSSPTSIGAGSIGLQYDCYLKIFSSTSVGATVVGYSPITLTRTSTTSNFLQIGWYGTTVNFSVDDVFVGNILDPSPLIYQWSAEIESTSVLTLVATGKSSSGCTFNGTLTYIKSGDSVTKRGFDWGLTVYYGTSWEETGSYDTGIFTHSVTTLFVGYTYHFRAKVYDSTVAAYRYGNDLTVVISPVTNPSVTTVSPATVTDTSAILQGSLTVLGDFTTVYLSFEYGTTSTLGYLTTEKQATAVGSFNEELEGLTDKTTYYYRAIVRYETSSYATGTILSFTTLSTPPGPPTDISSVGTGGSILISWTKSVGATNSLIRYSLTSSPQSITEGDQLYFGTDSSYTHTGLTLGTTYYYTIWCEKAGSYSVTGITTSCMPDEGSVPPPTTMLIRGTGIFSGYITPGDTLIVFITQLDYTNTPAALTSFIFVVQLLDAGGDVVAQSPVYQYGFKPSSIYLNDTISITWKGNYSLRVLAPRLSTITPYTYVLGNSNWKGDQLDDLDGWCCATGKLMELHDKVVADTYIKDSKIQDAAAYFFKTGIPMLEEQRPDLFATFQGPGSRSSSGQGIADQTFTWGSTFSDSMNALNGIVPIPVVMLKIIFFCLIFVIPIASAVVFKSNSVVVGISVSVMLVLLGYFTGMLPVAFVAIPGILIIVYATYHFTVQRSS